MLVAGKFPRFAAAMAIVAPVLLGLNLLFLPSNIRALLISNALDFTVVLVAALSCFHAARLCRGFQRQLWTLLAIALSLEAAAQGLTTYYQTFDRPALTGALPSDILFFVWAAPIFMIFLPRSESEDGSAFDWLRSLDFLQVGIVALTMYLYFFYSPARWHADEYAVLREILFIYIGRDVLLTAGFYWRSRSAVPEWFGEFSRVMAVVFALAALSDAGYLFTLNPTRSGPTSVDLLFAIPYVILVFFALSWKPTNVHVAAFPRSLARNFVGQQFLPIVLPMLVIFMAQAIAQERFVLAWLAVIVSVVCSSARLILTNWMTRRVAESLLAAEKALHTSEEMVSTAFRSSPDAFSINIFPNGPYLEVNDGFTLLTGYTREETLQKTPKEMSLWVDMSERDKVLSQLKETGTARDVEFHFRKKNGQIRVGQMSVGLVEIDGRTCSLVVVRDITVRKEAEEILRTSEERFRSLVQNLHVGILTFGRDGKIVFANQAVVDLLQIRLEKLIGKVPSEFGLTPLAEDGTVMPEEVRPVARVIATGAPLHNFLMGWRREEKVVWTLLDAVPEFTMTGEVMRVVVSVTNITQQRQAAEALRESEERFRTLVRDLQVAVILFRPDQRIEFANAAVGRIFDIPESTLIGRVPSDTELFVCNEDGTETPPEDRPVQTVLRTRTAMNNFLIGIRRRTTGKIVWMFGNVAPQFDGAGNLIRLIATLSDVSRMKNAEREIHQLSTQLMRLQDEERRRLGRELHDGLAQTVLAINLSLAQVRQSLLSTEHVASRALEKARSLTHQMSREIRTLSYLLHPPLLDELGLVSALREYVHGFSERSSIATQLIVLTEFGRLPQELELALFRIVQESLANIQRHSGSSTAEIRLRQDGPVVTLEVTDTGRGMVVPFNGASNAARLGVGVAGMRERMLQLGGRLEIDSGDRGTTVRATVSLAELKLPEEVADLTAREEEVKR